MRDIAAESETKAMALSADFSSLTADTDCGCGRHAGVLSSIEVAAPRRRRRRAAAAAGAELPPAHAGGVERAHLALAVAGDRARR